MTMEEIGLLIGLISTGVGLIGTLYAFAMRIVKDVKEKKLHALIEKAMIDAEQRDLNGVEKLMCVLNVLENEYGKDYGKIESNAKKYIEECIDFSKKVNSNK